MTTTPQIRDHTSTNQRTTGGGTGRHQAWRAGRVAALALGAVLALVLASCGDSSSSGSTSTAAPKSTTSASAGTSVGSTSAAASGSTVALADSSFGKILVDGSGHTLYQFTKDSGTTSSCSGGCAAAWPPVVATGTATAGTGVDASQLTVVPQASGTSQVAYAGHLLYTYAEDTAAGDTQGQGSGGSWFVVDASGAPVKAATTSSAAKSTTTKASGYGY